MIRQRLTPGPVLANVLRLRCPRCGLSKLFEGLFRMSACCEHCGLDIRRKPGYYLGSTYVNYGLTTLILVATFVSLRFGLRVPSESLVAPLAAFCVIFPLLFFRHARALWLGMDTLIDQPEDTSGP